MYANIVFARKPNRPINEAMGTIIEDFRKALYGVLPKNGGWTACAEESQGLAHVHSIIYYDNDADFRRCEEFVINYALKDKKRCSFIIKMTQLRETDDVKRYFKYIHKDITYLKYQDKKYRFEKLISFNILGYCQELMASAFQALQRMAERSEDVTLFNLLSRYEALYFESQFVAETVWERQETCIGYDTQIIKLNN